MEIGLGLGHTVLDGERASTKRGHSPTPILDPCLLWPNCWMDRDATWYGGRPRYRRHCLRWRPRSPEKGHSPHFSAYISGQSAGYGSRCHLVRSKPRPRRHCVRWGPRCPRERKGVQQPPPLSTHFALARSLISATAELLPSKASAS